MSEDFNLEDLDFEPDENYASSAPKQLQPSDQPSLFNSVTGLQNVLRRKAAGRQIPVSQWTMKGSGRYQPCGSTLQRIPPGIYVLGEDNQGPFLEEAIFPTDDLIKFPDGPIEKVMDWAERFWASKQAYKDLGLLHKTGILLWGPAGCGKSSAIKLLIQDMIDREGVILITDRPRIMPVAFRLIRDIEKERPIINIIEDIDDKMREYEDSTVILAMLDGEHQTDNVLQIATTNYPERLEERITQRPGRFDLIMKMDLPSKNARRIYLSHFPSVGGDQKKLDKIVNDTDGLGIAHLRGLIAAVEGLGLDYEETLARLKTNKKKAPKRGNGNVDFGFIGEEGRKR